ncbi:S41 family peptidase [Flavobacterium sp. GT3R68]|uniref:S41 family peptidase n=1 Tax=Flavobacterium sp. GT3R68 TaxID=2594437 RepID=UPI000F89108F|nr:S41 family peptidase [Flavobacterium sp. GT3R68]RTY93953.1 S41 family peptidase [Flavobacterium sp. GSN2]TRW93433.1 S41 family peptidase [Flavobacterium sp. GT3R68]
MKTSNKYFPIYIFATLAVGVVLGALLNFPNQGASFSSNSHRNKLNKLLDFINNEYVDNVNTDSIVDLAVTNILEKLDPHSVYVPPSQQSEVAESMKGDFVGIGVNFYMFNDTVAIIKPVEGGPSAKAGIKAGDRILYVNNDKLFGRKLPTDSLFSKLKGEVGSEIMLTIYRRSAHKKLHFKIQRDVVAIKSVDVATMMNRTTGYIKINRFAETTYHEFMTGLTKLKKQGMQSLIIDVRDNGGGYMEKAVEIADELLKDKQLIVFTKNKKGRTDKIFATANGSFESGKVFILINENSASASEILAGAIQDNDRGTIIGRRSFGKGLVQREIDFEDGSAVRLTVARYYTPTGRSIQKSYKNGNEDYFKEFDQRIQTGELYKKDSIKVDDTLKFKTPKGKTVYGGGGIVPDIFVPLEEEHGEEGVVYLMQSGIVSYYVFEQLDTQRKEFTGLPFPQFLTKMAQTDMYFNTFQDYLTKTGLLLKLGGNKALVKRYLAAEFARQLYGEPKYFEIVLKEDAMVKAVFTPKP